MATYEYGGKTYELADGTSNELALSKIKASLGEAPAQAAQGMEQIPTGGMKAPAAEPAKPPSIVEQMFGLGSPIARFAKGAVVDPLLGVNQLLANALPFGQDIRQGANANVRSYDQATDQARAAQGSTGFDPFQLVGAIASPANKLVGATQAVTKGGLAALGRSTGTGAVMAAVEPVRAPDDQFVDSKLTQIAVGAALGPVVEGGLKTLGAVYGAAKGLTAAGRDAAMRTHLDTLVGPDKPAAIERMRDAKQLVTGSRPTVAEVLSDLPSAVDIMAAQKKLSSAQGTGRFFEVRTSDNQAARLRAIDAIAGTPAERAAVAAERNATTGPMRETALDQSDMAGPIFTRLEKEISGKYNSVAAAETTSGMQGMAAANQAATAQAGKPGWLTAGDLAASANKGSGLYKGLAGNLRQEAQLKEFQLNSLEQNGFFPLRASDLTDQLDVAIRGASKDEVKAILQSSRDKIASKADADGIVSSRDLYENVRQVLNRDILAATSKPNQPFSAGLNAVEAKTSTNVKKFIDAALNKSSDGLWTQYIDSYTKYSNKLNRMEVGDFLSKKLNTPLDKESAGAFAAAVENAAGTIKKSTGLPRFTELSQVFTKAEVTSVENVLADLQRSTKAQEMSSKIRNVDGGLGDQAGQGFEVLNQKVTILKSALRFLQRGNQEAFDKKLAELMLNPPEAAKFMTKVIEKGKITTFTQALMKAMSPNTRAAFQQAFVIPAAAEEAGQ
jgi:hypothetical protein